LERLKPYLSANGTLVVSIPNIRYYKVIYNLLFRGVWDYGETGILDKSHITFFTLLTGKELLDDAGFEILHIKRNIIASRVMRLVNAATGSMMKELLTYQYFISARKRKDGKRQLRKRKKAFF